MRRDPAATFWVGILGIGAVLIAAALGALLLKPENPPSHFDTIAFGVLAIEALFALAAFLGLAHVGLENAGRSLRFHWPIAVQLPVSLEHNAATLKRDTEPKPQIQKAVTQLKLHGDLKLPGELSGFTPQILLCIDAIVSESPATKRIWFINDKIGDHQSASLTALLGEVIWETVTWVHLLTGAIAGGPYAGGQTAAISINSGVKKGEIWWTDPALGPEMQRAAYRIEQCFTSGQAGQPS